MKRKLNLKNNNIVIIFLGIKKHQIKLMIKLKNEKLGTLISGKMYINDKNNSFYKSILFFVYSLSIRRVLVRGRNVNYHYN